jgi:frataxin-like iron-binding protein CyaY
MKEYELRKSFWTPYEQYKEYIGRKFEVIKEFEDCDIEIKGELFEINFTDNNESIQAWFEEIYEHSCEVNGILV